MWKRAGTWSRVSLRSHDVDGGVVTMIMFVAIMAGRMAQSLKHRHHFQHFLTVKKDEYKERNLCGEL